MANHGKSLGRLRKVDPRNVWNDEAKDFTPWLAKEENIRLLSKTIGVELEVEETEVSVGPFSTDIVCKTTLDETVVIENQLEKTNHDHLGKVITYASGLDAKYIIWICKKFTEEHRKAIDWLNEITEDETNFFGLEIEVWQIGESPLAPKFNVCLQTK